MNQQKRGAPSSQTARLDEQSPPRGSCARAQWAAVRYEVPVFAQGFIIPARNNKKVFLPLLAKIPPQTLPGAPSVFLA